MHGMTPEAKVKSKVKRALHGLGFVFMPVQRGYGGAGLDYFCCLDGRFVAIETKAGKKKLNPRQLVVANLIGGAGGIVFVIRDDADIDTMLNALEDPHHGAGIYDTLGSVEMYGELWCT